MALIGLANQTLTTPSLMELTVRFKDEIPEDVCLYVREMFERNIIRNDRLAAQLAETVSALNARGVTPVLLKGAAMLATTPRERWGAKMMSDLDIMVPENETQTALDSLLTIGYALHFQTASGAPKWYTELKRSSDVGMVDLHCQLPGPSFFYQFAGDLKQHFRLVRVGDGSAYVPSSTFHAFVMTIHDQFQDYDYWMGTIDVRHLLDLRDLAHSPEGIDWAMLASFTPGTLARNALETQLIALSSLLGVDVPAGMCKRFMPRLQYKRRLIQARFPMLRQALLPVATLDYRNYREGVGATTGGNGSGAKKRPKLPTRDSLRFLLSLSRRYRAGKV